MLLKIFVYLDGAIKMSFVESFQCNNVTQNSVNPSSSLSFIESQTTNWFYG